MPFAKMPDRRGDPDHVNDENRDHVKLAGDDVESLFGLCGDGNPVKSRESSQPEIEHVKSDKEEQNDSGYALDQVKPVTRVRIGEIVGPRFTVITRP